MRKIGLAAILLITAGALTGCDVINDLIAPSVRESTPTPQPEPEETSLPQNTPSSEEDIPPITNDPPASQPLIVWTPAAFSTGSDQPGSEVLVEQLSIFDELNPDITIEIYAKQMRGSGSILAYLRSAPDVAPSILPDVVLLDREALLTAYAEELIIPIDSLLDDSSTEDMYESAVALGMVDRTMVGLPYMVEVQHTAYRTSFYDEAPASFEVVLGNSAEFVFAADTLGIINHTTLAQYLSAGGILTNQDGTPVVDPGALRQVLTFYYDAYQEQLLDPALFQMTSAAEAWEQYLNRRAHLAVITSTSYLSQRDEVSSSTSVSWIPSADGEPFALVSGRMWAITTKDPARQEQVMTFLQYMMDPVNHGEYSQAVHWLPSQRTALTIWGNSDSYATFGDLLLESSVPYPDAATLGDVGKAIQEAFENVLLNGIQPVQATNEAVQKISPQEGDSP